MFFNENTGVHHLFLEGNTVLGVLRKPLLKQVLDNLKLGKQSFIKKSKARVF